MKLCDITDICLNSETPIKIIIRSFYFDGKGESEIEEELDLITAIRLKDKEVHYYDFQIKDTEIICFVQMP